MIREPAVAGQFYPAKKDMLEAQLKKFIDVSIKKEDALALISPHAGYVYSGPVAGALYSYVAIADVALILGPNHTGLGAQFSIMAHGVWRTPLGDVQIDE